jgi:hypothetical protein
MNEAAITLYSTAKGYVQAVFAMMISHGRSQLPNDTTLFLPFHNLGGFAVEIYLKAVLAHKGFDENKLKGLGHDLQKSLALCISEGLSVPGADVLVHLFGPKHKSLEYRYMKPDTAYKAAHLHFVFAAFSSLDIAVDIAIGASSSHGKAPGVGWVFPPELDWRLPMETSAKIDPKTKTPNRGAPSMPGPDIPAQINIAQTQEALIVTNSSLLIALQTAMRYAVLDAGGNLQTLVRKIREDVKNADADGFNERDVHAGKSQANKFIGVIEDAISRETLHRR